MLHKILTHKKFLVIFLLGFSSGLPAALTASTLQAWFTEAGINLKTIGAITLLVFPYSFRFLWSPIFDFFEIPGFERRKGWLYLTQILLILLIALMAFSTPQDYVTIYKISIPQLLVLGCLTAFFSSSQDIVINAYQIEILSHAEKGIGAAIHVAGWRFAAVFSGAIALILAQMWGFKITYLWMASFMVVGLVGTFLGPVVPTFTSSKQHFLASFFIPLIDLFKRYSGKSTLIFLLLILTYKASEAMTLALNTTFLLRYIGYDLATIGLVNKTISLVSALLGAITAGVLMKRMSLYHSLVIFGFIQGAATLSYAAMAYYGKSFILLIFSAFLENFCSGMGSIALFALLMSLCSLEYSATQFALLSAIAFITRTFVGPIASSLVETIGWTAFFFVCFIVSFPTLFFVRINKGVIYSLGHSEK